MNLHDVRSQAWSMPLTSPIYPRGPYRFVNREFMVISYRTDPALLAETPADEPPATMLSLYPSLALASSVAIQGEPI